MVDSPNDDVDETGDNFSKLSLHEVGQPENVPSFLVQLEGHS